MNAQDQAFEALSRWRTAIRPIEQLNARIESELSSRHALCISGYEVLYVLASHRGKTPLTEIRNHVDRSQPRVSRLINQLEERGMVDRYRASSDGRAYQLAITRKGRRVLDAAAGTVLGILGEQDGPWTTDFDWRSFINGQDSRPVPDLPEARQDAAAPRT